MHLMHDKMRNCIDTGFFGQPPVAQVARACSGQGAQADRGRASHHRPAAGDKKTRQRRVQQQALGRGSRGAQAM